MSQYSRDQQIESFASEFLDNHFYSIFANKTTVTRYDDTYHQFGGIDVSIGKINFDEKCKCYGCLNQVQQYVGFECSIKNRGGYISDGWFLNDTLSTDYYSIIGLSSTVSTVNELTSETQLSAIDVLWIKKSDVIQYIADNNLTIDQLKQDVQEIRERGDSNKTDIFGHASLDSSGKCRTKYSHSNFWLTYSTRMRERPVNLVVPRSVLESLPHSKHFIVHRDRVNRI